MLAGLIGGGAAHAQFGFGLPQNDFTWTWGDMERRTARLADISAQGHDGKFQCTLEAMLRPGSRFSATDVRQLETELQTTLEFVRTSAQMMNALDAQRELEWAVLSCKEREAAPVSAEERRERETKARERMQREIERRRERQQRDEGDDER
jgi:hypothetical protein